MSSSRAVHYTQVHIPLPPPPDEDARAAASRFRTLLSEARPAVKTAVFMTLYSWDWAWNETLFNERLAWKTYEVCPPGLKKALDLIVTHDIPVYIQDDRELRRHVYFGCGSLVDLTKARGGTESSNLLSPGEFARSLRSVGPHVQASMLRTFSHWTDVRLVDQYGDLLKPRKLEQLYSAAPEPVKIALSFIHHFEYDQRVNNQKDLDRLTEFQRKLHDEDHRWGGLRRCDHENIVRLWGDIVEAVLEDG
ncbi:unnamed protein product [Peniophora sp. CBMAI 1063]|nr:unnamed protein product [Peniophora sp. CBMAI 1063]